MKPNHDTQPSPPSFTKHLEPPLSSSSGKWQQVHRSLLHFASCLRYWAHLLKQGSCPFMGTFIKQITIVADAQLSTCVLACCEITCTSATALCWSLSGNVQAQAQERDHHFRAPTSPTSHPGCPYHLPWQQALPCCSGLGLAQQTNGCESYWWTTLRTDLCPQHIQQHQKPLQGKALPPKHILLPCLPCARMQSKTWEQMA